ncbi:MAG: CPBP family intramembrane metalloprotease [Acidobacteria bacterium]|nr:CPBP family intramembrane metalloprotease [Acidobacteriota bacterium]
MQNEDIDNLEYNFPPPEPAENKIETAPTTPDNPPWNSWMALAVWLLSVLAIVIFPVLFLVPYVMKNGRESLHGIDQDPTAILLNLLAVIPAHLFTLAVAWSAVTRNNRYSLGETLGFRSGGFKWWYYPLILIGFFVLAGVVGHYVPDGDNDLLKMLRSSRAAVFIVVVLATFTAPVVEEVVYRGLLYSAFQRSFGKELAILTTTLLFALVHVPQYWGSPATILLICVLSLVLTMIRAQTGSLLPCIIMHTIFNGIQSLVLLINPDTTQVDTGLQEKVSAILRLFT